MKRNYKMITFTNTCPFKAIHAVDVPKKQHASRTESYVALPPLVSESLGFHNNNTLAVYQGLVYYLLWLHSKYDKPYADPVHDPTWRWWQHKTKDKVGGHVGSWRRTALRYIPPGRRPLADHPVHPGLLLLPVQQPAGGRRHIHQHERLPKALQHVG